MDSTAIRKRIIGWIVLLVVMITSAYFVWKFLPGRKTLFFKTRIAAEQFFSDPKLTKVDFDQFEDKEIIPETNINQQFSKVGLRFDHDRASDFVSAKVFSLESRSEKFSAAVHRPAFQGSLFLRFHMPDQPQSKAGVHEVGFYIGSVFPNGTTIEAYDQNNVLMKRMLTSKEGTEFIGMKSNIPIFQIKISPQLEIDPDFAIDDLIFSEPQPASWFY